MPQEKRLFTRPRNRYAVKRGKEDPAKGDVQIIQLHSIRRRSKKGQAASGTVFKSRGTDGCKTFRMRGCGKCPLRRRIRKEGGYVLRGRYLRAYERLSQRCRYNCR